MVVRMGRSISHPRPQAQLRILNTEELAVSLNAKDPGPICKYVSSGKSIK